ncbi:GGDEF domain-containing protein [Aquabacterium sp.]|uniref:GGDEF domain-containing protein n=1 Tax=Aquabacterium sp. TaxID=1872578 RepID=UPI002BFB1633|nr:GGDEF domain-containing protein [Aquabacterium sp.]HSW08918.1 GGDEF domain-containing protein [Aquabacterium sp.]
MNAVPPAEAGASDRDALLTAHADCLACFHRGLYGTVVDDAPALLPRLAAAGLEAERRDLLYALAMCACEAARFDIAIESAQALGIAAAREGSAGPLLQAAFALGAALERLGDAWQAERVLAEALTAPGAPAPARERMVALNGLCAITIGVFHRLRDVEEPAQGRAVLARARGFVLLARELLPQAPDARYEVAIAGNLGEVLLHLGELDAAQPLLLQAQALARERGYQAHVWRIACSLGEWALASGDAAGARQAMQALLAELGPDAPPQTQIRAHQAAYRAGRALGLFEEALQHFEAAEHLERRRVTRQLRAQSQLFVTRSEAEHALIDAQRQRALATELAERAERDPLTGLGNRRHLDRRFAELLSEAERHARPLAVAVMDIDHFKQINDTHGHAAGDCVLVALAPLLRENMRAGDALARVGGEEFVVVFADTPIERAAEVCERLRERLAGQRWPGLPEGQAVTLSIGLAGAAPYDAAELMRRADAALYEAKRLGRNRVCS